MIKCLMSNSELSVLLLVAQKLASIIITHSSIACLFIVCWHRSLVMPSRRRLGMQMEENVRPNAFVIERERLLCTNTAWIGCVSAGATRKHQPSVHDVRLMARWYHGGGHTAFMTIGFISHHRCAESIQCLRRIRAANRFIDGCMFDDVCLSFRLAVLFEPMRQATLVRGLSSIFRFYSVERKAQGKMNVRNVSAKKCSRIRLEHTEDSRLFIEYTHFFRDKVSCNPFRINLSIVE